MIELTSLAVMHILFLASVLGTSNYGHLNTQHNHLQHQDDIHHAEEDRAPNLTSSCELPPSGNHQDEVIALSLLLKESVLIYFHLHIDGITNLYESRTDIDPSTFILSLKGKGYYLLTLPYDFVYLSLGTLSSGVHDMEVDVPLPSEHCFRKQSDESKERLLVAYLSSLADAAISLLDAGDNFYHAYQIEEYKICVEMKPIRTDPTDAKSIDTIYQCFLDGTTEYVEKAWWVTVLRFIGFIVTAFSPLILVNFTRKYPPLEIDDETFVETRTDIPLGVHNLLFHSWSDRKCFVTLRTIFYIVLLTILPHSRWIIYSLLEGKAFVRRLNCTFFHDFSSIDTILIVSFVLVMILCFWISAVAFMMLSSKDLPPGIRRSFVIFVRSLWSIPRTRSTILHEFGPLELPSSLEHPGSALNKFGCYVLRRFQTLFYPPLWSSFFTHNGWQSMCWIAPFIVSLLFYSVPFLYVPYQPLIEMNYQRNTSTNNNADGTKEAHDWPFHFDCLCSYFPLIKNFFLLLLCFSVMVFTNISASLFIIYLMEIAAFTTIGLLINYNTMQGAFYAATIFIAFILKIFIRFYDRYKARLRLFIDIAISVDKIPNSQFEDENKTPFVRWELFQRYITVYKPVYVEVTKVAALIIFLSIFAMFVFHHMVVTMEIADVPSVANAIGVLILSRILPTLNVFTSQESQLTEKEEIRSEIKQFVLKHKESTGERLVFLLKSDTSYTSESDRERESY